MKIFDDVRNYIGENNFRIILYKDKVDIINYEELNEISDNRIIVKSNKTLIINGKNLKLNKMLNKEVLIIGEISSINFNE
ncbi:MAG: YabP/YqfC family sporulation protein [Bacilli bacterium]|nr:YabP/YqfC family sporulation protein [Bacilli bacterium]